MIKQMAIVTRRPDMTHEEFIDYVKHIHGYKITSANPLGIYEYIQNYVYDAAYGAKSDVLDGGYKIVYGRDSVTELYFEDAEAMAKTFSDPYVHKVVGPDGPNFSDLGKSLPFLVTEEEVEVTNPSPGGIKIFYFIKKNDTLSSEEFNRLWFEAHNEIMTSHEGVRSQLRRFINNVQVSAGESNYFGSTETISYDGVATMWFDTTAAFRMYQSELALIAQRMGDFINQSATFFLYTDPLTIFKKVDGE
ncbi:EthD domain-containing protein [Paenibacillus sp. NRS-1782]|uniref:EthD domain-containing protein n=1 Tax=unclassified Paenibacillus TaxID=185978 RepID=UPI003D28884D